MPEEEFMRRVHRVDRLAISFWRAVCVMKSGLHIIPGDITHAICIIGWRARKGDDPYLADDYV